MTSRVDRALAWPSSMSETKVMAQKSYFTPKIRKCMSLPLAATVARDNPLVTSPQENPQAKTENFFWLGSTRLAESVEGLNTSLAAAAGELWPKTLRTNLLAFAVVKGFWWSMFA